MTIRLGQYEDLPAVDRIVVAAYAKYIPRMAKPPGPMLDNHEAHLRAGHLWVYERDDAIVGLIVLSPESACLLVDHVAVAPAMQGQGIGRTLLQFADAEALRQAYTALRLYTNVTMTEVSAMFERAGWQETGRFVQHGYDRIFFSKRVLPGPS